jgi:hypothetical protein
MAAEPWEERLDDWEEWLQSMFPERNGAYGKKARVLHGFMVFEWFLTWLFHVFVNGLLIIMWCFFWFLVVLGHHRSCLGSCWGSFFLGF